MPMSIALIKLPLVQSKYWAISCAKNPGVHWARLGEGPQVTPRPVTGVEKKEGGAGETVSKACSPS